MKDFRLYEISDFVLDEDFIRWVNEKKVEDVIFWEGWLSQHPGKYMVVEEARRIVEAIGTEQKIISEIEKQAEIKKLMHTISGNGDVKDSKVLTISTSRKWWYAAAASVAIAIVSISIYFLVSRNKTPEQYTYAALTLSKQLVENINTSDKTVNFLLPDGSSVALSANSRISYANDFDSIGTRDIYLSGDAFFTVIKNPSRPFRVFAGEIVTKVLGTSFRVRSFEKDTTIQVTVRTGKVSVYSQATADTREIAAPNRLGGIILTPNQEIVYRKSKKEFQKALLENPVMIQPEVTPENMLYEDVSLVKVFSQFSNIYGVNILYDNELLKKCTVTADLRNEKFYKQLELICKAVGARYEIIDGQVVIQTKGCGA